MNSSETAYIYYPSYKYDKKYNKYHICGNNPCYLIDYPTEDPSLVDFWDCQIWAENELCYCNTKYISEEIYKLFNQYLENEGE